MPLIFNPNFEILDNIIGDTIVSNKMIENEPMFYQSDLDFVSENCHRNSLTFKFLDYMINNVFKGDYENEKISIDSRVHLLMKNWYPCIPGWHTDNVPRTDNGQPNYFDPNNKFVHYMCVIGDSAMTEFLNEPFTAFQPPKDSIYYDFWNKAIKKQKLKTFRIDQGDIVKFDSNTWHRGVAADKFCWRWFIRLTVNKSDIQFTQANKIRRQSQVYLQAIEGGW